MFLCSYCTRHFCETLYIHRARLQFRCSAIADKKQKHITVSLASRDSFTWSLAVKDIRAKDAVSSFFCNIGIIQLTESTDCRKEQVPQPCFPGLHLNAQITCVLKLTRASFKVNVGEDKQSSRCWERSTQTFATIAFIQTVNDGLGFVTNSAGTNIV